MENHQFHLIKNTYSVEKTREILLSLLNDKIKFLNLQILSLEERFGSDMTQQRQRVEELKREKVELMSVLNKFQDGAYSIDIDCLVNLNIKPNSPLKQEDLALHGVELS